MAKIRSIKVQKIRFEDVAQFSEADPDLDLIDIINDATKELSVNNFINSRGAFVYEIDLAVDVRKVMELGVEGFRVEFFRKNPQVKLKKKNESRSQQAKNHRARLRKHLRERKPRPVFAVKLDLNVPLPPRNFQLVRKPKPKPPRTHRVLIDKPPILTGRLFASKITARPLLSAAKTSGKGRLVRSALRKSLFKYNADPVQVLMRPSPVFPTFSAKMSKASVPLIEIPRLDDSDRISLNDIRVRRSLEESREGIKDQLDDDSKSAQILESVVSSNQDTLTSQDSLLGYVIKVQNNLQRIRRQIEVPKWSIGVRKNLYVRIVPILQKPMGWSKISRTTTPYVFVVSHRQKIKEILTPEFPPEISLVKNKKGMVVLKLKQVDPGATKIIVTKRMYTKSKMKMTPPTMVQVLKTEGPTPPALVVDYDAQNVFPHHLIYRAQSMDTLGNLGPAASITVEGIQKIAIPVFDDPNELSIVAKNELDGIRIDIERIPIEVVSLRLMRESIDRKGDLSERVFSVPDADNKTLIDVGGEIDDHSFMDNGTSLHRSYRYFAVMRQSIGGEFISSEDEVITRLHPTKPLPVEVSLENIQLTEVELGNFTVSVDLLSEPHQSGIDFVVDLLKRSGVSAEFLSDLEEQRALFSSLAVFIVERVDRVTGRRASFGQVAPGQFSDDSKRRSLRKLPELRSDSRYTYFFKLCLRPPQSLMKSVFTKFSTYKNPGVDDQSALAQKFMSAYSEAFGALPSTKELIEGVSVEENFRQGETGVILEMDVRTPEARPLPAKLRSKVGRKGRWKHVVGLRWKLEGGDLGRVDHCLVFVEYADRKICIGTVPSSGTSRNFRFIDKIYGPQIGTKRYTVKCVYDDLKVSPSSDGTKTHRRSSTPRRLLSGKMLGVASRPRRVRRRKR